MGQIHGIDELSERFASAKERKRRSVTDSIVGLVDDRRNNVRILQIVIIIRAKNIARDN